MVIVFEFTTLHGRFCDALHLNDGHTFTEAEIEAMKQERLSNWLAIIESPPTDEAQAVEET